MKRRKVDSQRERRLLIALVVSTPFLSQASQVLDLDLIDSAHFKQVAEWCLEYFSEYAKAPGEDIENLYHAWSEDNENRDLVDSVHDFLESLSSEYTREQEINVPYLVDELGLFLSKRRLQRTMDDLQFSLTHGKIREAEAVLQAYRTVELGQGAGFDPFQDEGVWEQAFAEGSTPLIDFEGDAGRFFNAAMVRDSFIGVQAPEKTGKTFWCVEFVVQALRRRRKVAFFQVGDLSQNQVLVRLGMRWSGRPQWKRQCGKILVPHKVRIDETEDMGYKVASRVKVVDHVVSHASTARGMARFQRACGLSKDVRYLMTSVHPMSTINVAGISSILDRWASEHSFIPDVIVIDYVDILAPEQARSKEERRDQIDTTWKALRRLSQERHALVIAPTQAKASTYDRQGTALQSMGDFSEDKRKYAHVTGMLGLNQTPEEKDMGGMRLNWLVLRNAPFNIQKPLYVGTCFTLARALCCSSL